MEKYKYLYQVKHDYPLKCRVRMSDLGRKSFPQSAAKKGAVVGYARDAFAVYVLWDGRKTPACFNVGYLERIVKA